MPVMDKSMFDIQSDIRTEIQNVITSERNGGLLTELESDHYGERINLEDIFSAGGSIDLPGLWTIPEEHDITEPGVQQEEHPFEFNFAVMVRDTDASAGRDTVEDILADVYDSIDNSRSLNDMVQEAHGTVYRPAVTRAGGDQVHWGGFSYVFIARRYRA